VLLRSVIRVDRKLRRVWVLSQRIHHGAVGVGLIALGTALTLHDSHDYRDWFRRDRWT
jgi:hypothetical protein